MKKWRNEQLEYFKSYMKSFKKNSREYKLLKKSINQLEDGP
jgi:hypothetical protein